MKGRWCMAKAKGVPRCEYLCVHQEVVDRVNREMPEEELLFDLAELFKIFGDSTRVKFVCTV